MKKLFAILAAAMLPVAASAADYPWMPDKPITIIVPWGAGGATDQVTRVTAGVLEDALGQKVVIVNQPGASGSIGKKNAYEAEHDGYTWAAGAPKQLGTYKLLGQWDTWIDDWRLYNTVTNVPLVAVNPNAPYATMDDFIAAMKDGGVTIATAGAGSSGHAAAEALKGAVGGSYKHVTYDGGNPAVVATVAGEAEATTQLASEQAEMVRAGRLKPLAVLADQPLEIDGYGTVPPITDFVDEKLPILSTAFGIFIPVKGTPPEVIETFDAIWSEVIPNAAPLKTYALEKGALFTPAAGDAARDKVWPEVQADAWSFDAAGRTKMSPDELGIPKP
ncbi:Bug family tripartite tricarboxylate transporter substrate binding protein [Acuticoccus mangrovi]|uniref:Tripartite tricarboxylate transporter substrate binding protein n=1 Tax=Acuticoccus mangrovi TaxID=2796142 RepID=A0A934MH96_9HYPH|nr:tripartite tricarboxylate transporter substrate binding protein [Acuticoccus mangrovi]MBJ3775826.1 tripartite tricarboxylate transporter substrate binding protein [Acuticoccus mangrovi]